MPMAATLVSATPPRLAIGIWKMEERIWNVEDGKVVGRRSEVANGSWKIEDGYWLYIRLITMYKYDMRVGDLQFDI